MQQAFNLLKNEHYILGVPKFHGRLTGQAHRHCLENSWNVGIRLAGGMSAFLHYSCRLSSKVEQSSDKAQTIGALPSGGTTFIIDTLE